MNGNIRKKWSFSDSIGLYIGMLFVIAGGVLLQSMIGFSTAGMSLTLVIVVFLLGAHGIIIKEYSSKKILLLMYILNFAGIAILLNYTIFSIKTLFFYTLVTTFVLAHKKIHYLTRDRPEDKPVSG
jgi:hypothetical protein